MVLLVGELLERSAIMEAEMLVFKKGLYGLIGALVLSLGCGAREEIKGDSLWS
jgi:hypothetical protein